VASLIPPLLDDLKPLVGGASNQTQYQLVIEKDHRMRELVLSIPTFLLRPNVENDLIPWLSIARRSLTITAADKVCVYPMIFADI